MSGAGSYRDALEGSVRGEGRRIAIVVARFHPDVTEPLLDSARGCLLEHGLREEALEVFRVPGAWELPQAALRAAGCGRFDAVVALGCVIRGETAHFDFVAGEAARGLARSALDTGVPVALGVLTTDTREQALARAVPPEGDKGREAALSALEMAELFDLLDERAEGRRPSPMPRGRSPAGGSAP